LYTLAPILARENGSDPVFVFILAGTNDLAFRTSTMTILWHLKRMHNAVQLHALSIKRNIYSMAITIPPVRWDGDQSRRLLLNDGLRKYATRCSTSVVLLDMEPVFNVSRKDTAYLWSRDSLHLSKAGYDRMGGMVYDKMVEFLSAKGESSLHGMDYDEQCQ
jgi:lysophospholipase L1-like esterase